MKRFLVLLPLVLMIFGCATNYFNVPKENFADKVKVLGVVPIIVDAGSDIKYPQKELLTTLLAELNRKYEQQFVRMLKATGNFYTVALLDGDPQSTFTRLLYRSEKRDDATIQYNKYFWKNDELRSYMQKNNLDAVMLIVVSGITKSDKIYSSTLLSSLTSDYNYLIMTAQILDANGTILWEYPNFRRRLLTYYPLINLQYPDFSEAEANLAAKPEVKFKTFDGIKRTLEQKRKDMLLRETQEPEIYGKQFDEMLSFLKYDQDSKEEAPAEKTKPQAEPAKPAEQVTKPAPPATAPAPAAPAAEAQIQSPPSAAPVPPPPPADATPPVKGTIY